MSELRVSVIVPVYNAEKYLDKCIQSILNQTEKNIEVILVDDGSTDASGRICDEYKLRDDRIIVIHQINQGVSVARNIGIQAAKGEYIGFVDADDWIEPMMYEKMYSVAMEDDSDIVMCDALTVYSNGCVELDTIELLSAPISLTKEKFQPELVLQMAGAVWRGIYKSELIRSNMIHFPDGLKFSEDRIFNLYAIGYAKTVSYTKETYYNRYINKESVVHRFHVDYFEMYKKTTKYIDEAICLAWNDSEQLHRAYLGQFIQGAFGAICNYYYKTSLLSIKERRNAVKRICLDDQLRFAIEQYGINIKSRWILNKNYDVLIIYAKLSNWKYKR